MASLTRTVAQSVIKPRKFRPAPPKDLMKRIVSYLGERVSFSLFYLVLNFDYVFMFFKGIGNNIIRLDLGSSFRL